MPFVNEDYTVAWISALSDELAAAQALLDEEHEDLQAVPGDHNAYTLGRIGKHNVVIAGLPRGTMGMTSAASVAANLLRSFPNVRFGLMVGVGGGVPDAVRLGDIVVSNPEGQSGGVIQYDFGTAVPDGYVRKGALPGPPTVISTAVTKLSAYARRKGYRFHTFYDEMLAENPRMEDFRRPPSDVLYEREYLHVGAKADCSKCDPGRIVARAPCSESTVHYSLIGSGNSVIRDAAQRDLLYEQEGIICFEMEAAGLMKDFPCLVIRGICDYCDTHKNKHWQPYAGGIAAAYAKELLLTIPGYAVAAMPQNELLEAVGQQTLEIRTLNITGREAHETAKETHSTIQSINAKLEGSRQKALEDKDLQCLHSLNAADPRIDKTRIEDMKGGLLKNAYKWITQNQEFLDWRRDGQLLWIRGDPGKGKTMLLCGIIDILENELNNRQFQTSIDESSDRKLIYFFCQANDNANNSASAVLRGLVYTILQQSPLLIDNVRDQLDRYSGMQAANSLYVLTGVFEALLEKVDFYILIDALDECTVQRDKLLQIILRSSEQNKARWIVTSRNWNDIRQHFDSNSTVTPQISLELNAESVSQAVLIYINYKVAELTSSHRYDNDLRDFIHDYLVKHAGGTFLWVALVCMRLVRLRRYQIRKILTEYAAGLDEVYDRMITTIEESSNEDLLKQLLRIISVAFEPIHLDELPNIMDLPDELSTNVNWLEEVIGDCGSFLIVRAGRIEFVHQSAKDYIDKRLAGTLLAKSELHIQVYDSSIRTMYQKLQRDIYNLQDPGTHMEDITQPIPDPLVGLRYCCIYWLRHLIASDDTGENRTITLLSFLRQRFLYWLEAMILLRSLHGAFHLLRELEDFAEMQVDLKAVVTDAYNFASYFREIVEEYPLQLYFTGLTFCPIMSEIGTAFRNDLDDKITILQDTRNFNWPRRYVDINCKVTLTALQYSHDGLKLAVADVTGKIQLFDTISGEVLQSVLLPFPSGIQKVSSNKFEYSCITDLVFQSNDLLLLVKWENVALGKYLSVMDDRDILQFIRARSPGICRCQFHTWDFSTCQWNIISGIPTLTQLAVADRNANWIAYWTPLSSNNSNDRVMLLDVRTKAIVLSFPYSIDRIKNIVFSADSGNIAVSSEKNHLHVWDTYTGATTCTLTVPGIIRHLALCPTKTRVAVVMRLPFQLAVYDTVSGDTLWCLPFSGLGKSIVDFSPDGKALVLRSGCSCRIYDASTGIVQQDFYSHASELSVFEFSAQYRHITLADYNKLRLFTVNCDITWPSSESPDNDPWWRVDIYCSPFATDIVLKYKDDIIIWNMQTGSMVLHISQKNLALTHKIFDYLNGYIIAAWVGNGDFDATTEVTLSRLQYHHIEREVVKYGINCRAISPSGSLIVFTDLANDVHLLSFENQKTIQLYLGEMKHVLEKYSPVFSHHENHIASIVWKSTSASYAAIVWSADNGEQLMSVQLSDPPRCWTISLSPSGRSVYIGSQDIDGLGISRRIYHLQNKEPTFDDLPYIATRLPDAKIGWCSSTIKDFPAYNIDEISPITFGVPGKNDAINPRPIVIEVNWRANTVSRKYPQIRDAQTVYGAKFSINTTAGVLTTTRNGLECRYGTDTDIYVHHGWIYQNGRRLMLLPHQLRLDASNSGYASQCLVIPTQTNGIIMLKFGLDHGTVNSGDQGTKLPKDGNSQSSTIPREVDGTRRMQEYLILPRYV